jgi:hypothetical protein
MRKSEKQIKTDSGKPLSFPVLKDGGPPPPRLSMDEYLEFIESNMRLFPELYKDDDLENWKKRLVTERFVIR